MLGLINMHPNVSGYQLRSIVNNSTSFLYPAHLSQIYPSLKRISSEGWATSVIKEQDGKPNQKLYSITEKGLRELTDWLTGPYPFKYSRSNYDEYFMKFAVMGYLPDEAVLAYIDQGLEYFGRHLGEIQDENMRYEKEFLGVSDAAARDRYEKLWRHEFAYMLEEVRSRLAWLEDLKHDIESAAGSSQRA